MNQRNTLDKANYILLSIPNIIVVTVMVPLALMGTYLFFVGSQDTNGGGWIMFLVMLFGVLMAGLFICWILQALFFLIGFKKYLRANYVGARRMALVSSIFAIISCAVFVLFMIPSFDAFEQGKFITASLLGYGLTYSIITFIISVINMTKHN